MCGRYSLYAPRSEIARRYRYQEDWISDMAERYNVAPGTEIPIVTIRDGDEGPVSVLMPAHWGFHPSWAEGNAPSPINARAEKVATSRYFREAFQKRRALVPANGWYEWRQMATGGKQPYYITHADGELLMLAGLWEPGDEYSATAAIITQPAAGKLKTIHPRMPSVLDPACWNAWLDPTLTDRDRIREVTRPLPSDALVASPVSQRVNRPANDDPGLVVPEANPDPSPPG